MREIIAIPTFYSLQSLFAWVAVEERSSYCGNCGPQIFGGCSSEERNSQLVVDSDSGGNLRLPEPAFLLQKVEWLGRGVLTQVEA